MTILKGTGPSLWRAEPEGFLCVFCPVCTTLMLLAEAEAGRCCQTPERPQCPYRPGEARRKPPETP